MQPINTDDNIADILTKALFTTVLRGHLANMHAGIVIGLPDSTGIYLPPRGIGSVGEQEPSVAAHRRLKIATGGALGVISSTTTQASSSRRGCVLAVRSRPWSR
jgi:hypothetical protein